MVTISGEKDKPKRIEDTLIFAAALAKMRPIVFAPERERAYLRWMEQI